MKNFIFPKFSLFLFIIKCKYNIYDVPKLDTSSDFNTNLTLYFQKCLEIWEKHLIFATLKLKTVLEERDLIVYILEQRHKSHYWLYRIFFHQRIPVVTMANVFS